MLLVDAHVHIYDCFNLKTFFDSAYCNFKTHADRFGHGDDFTGILLLAETARDNWFHNLSSYAEGHGLPGNRQTGPWRFHHTAEAESLCARSDDNRKLFLIAGRQVVAAEGLEVLALAGTGTFSDGTLINELIESVLEKDEVPVIPWGVGKWVGKRGTVVRSLLETGNKDIIFLGDNSGRPIFWPRPGLFKKGDSKGFRILPGSDPLPFADECHRVGNFGFMILWTLSLENPAKDLKQFLLNSTEYLRPYGRLERPLRFFHNQINLRLRPFLSRS